MKQADRIIDIGPDGRQERVERWYLPERQQT